jgi:hypothetical protein
MRWLIHAATSCCRRKWRRCGYGTVNCHGGECHAVRKRETFRLTRLVISRFRFLQQQVGVELISALPPPPRKLPVMPMRSLDPISNSTTSTSLGSHSFGLGIFMVLRELGSIWNFLEQLVEIFLFQVIGKEFQDFTTCLFGVFWFHASLFGNLGYKRDVVPAVYAFVFPYLVVILVWPPMLGIHRGDAPAIASFGIDPSVPQWHSQSY